MSTYYIIKDPLNAGKIRYLLNTWPAPDGGNGTGNTDITTLLNLASGNTIVVDGGASGLTYSGTELFTNSTLSPFRSNFTFRSPISSDPSYTSHNGLVTFLAANSAVVFAATSASNITVSNFIFQSTTSGASKLLDFNIASGTVSNCTIIANSSSHTNVIAVRGNGTNMTFSNLTYSGTCNANVILHTNGTLTVSGGNIDASHIASNAAINSSGANVIVVIDLLTLSGNVSSTSSGFGISVNTDISFTLTNSIIYNFNTSAIITSNSNSVSIHGNLIYNITNGYGISNGSAGANIYNNTIHDVTYASNGYGIYSLASNCTIYNNIIYNVDAMGIYIGGSTSNVYLNTIHDCWNKLARGKGGIGSGIGLVDSASGNLIYRNYIYNNFIGISFDIAAGTGANAVFSNLVVNNYISGIDDSADTGINHEMIYNNTVIHNPSYAIGDSTYVGHGITAHIAAKKVKVINNIVIVYQASGQCDGLSYSRTNDNLIEVISDYNQIYAAVPSAVIGTLDFVLEETMASWISLLKSSGNNKIHGLDGTVDSVEAHSSDADPKLISSSDFHLSGASPCINAGYDLGSSYSIDYDGISQYSSGTYSIGAYAYVGILTISYIDNVLLSNISKLYNLTNTIFGKVLGHS